MAGKGMQDVALFAGLGRKEVAALERLADEIDVRAGAELMTEGRAGQELFVVRSGTAVVTKGGEHVDDVGPGDHFGEVALLEHVERNATVTATTDMDLYVLTAQAFATLRHTMPGLHARIAETIAARRGIPSAQRLTGAAE